MDRGVDACGLEIIVRWTRAAVLSLPVAFLCLFLLYPLGKLLVIGLAPLARSGASAVLLIAGTTGLWNLLGSSALQALASTALSLAVGLPAAYVFARLDFPLKRLLRTLLTIPFVLPTTVVGSAFIALIGTGGFIERLIALFSGRAAPELGMIRTLPAVLMAHVFFNVAVVVRIVGGYWATLDPRVEEAAKVLGARAIVVFFRVTLRLLMPAVAAAGILVFSFCFTSFGTVLILGGPRMGTLETEIYRQAVHLFNLPAAAFLALMQLAITTGLMLLYSRFQSAMRITLKPAPPAWTAREPRTAGEKALTVVFGICLTAVLMLPPAMLVVGSLSTRNGISLEYWTGLFVNLRDSLFWSSPMTAVRNSMVFSLAAVAIALVLGVPAAYAVKGRGIASLLDVLFLLPLGVSAVTLGFGFLIALDAPPLDLRSSVLIIPIAHAMAALPLVTRSIASPLRSIGPSLREAAAVLGAGGMRVLREVDFPILRPALVGAAAFAFTVSLGEFAATALLTRPELMTIPVSIYGYLGRPGELNHGQAFAMSTLLMMACGLGLAVIERVRIRGTEIF